MNKIKYKIHSFDEDTNSVVVSFSSDETATNNPDDYTPFAFQPIQMYPDITDMEELKKRIAQQGIGLAEEAKRAEDANNNTTMINNWKALVGQTFEYNTSDVLDSGEVSYTNEINVPDEAE
jgi:chromosome condensin MukBEF complex kleisin-like MukF subunit